MVDLLAPMRSLLLRHCPDGHHVTSIQGIFLHRESTPTAPTRDVYDPLFGLVVQGAKEVTVGTQRFRYEAGSYFLSSVELAVSTTITDATPEKPYLAMHMWIDTELMSEMIFDAPIVAEPPFTGIGIGNADQPLASAIHRLLALLDVPADISPLAPLYKRETIYRLLTGDLGQLLRQIALGDSTVSRLRRAIQHIRLHYQNALSIELLAHVAGMSRASLHRHFRALTKMTPLQYQKTLRLLEARKLLLGHCTAEEAAYRVGYESASQFSREYARMFGIPPKRDAIRKR
jgi:AraC-like DNA-binding protein